LLGRPEEAQAFTRDAQELDDVINRLMWDPDRRFYFDLSLDGKRAPVRTIAAFWALLGRVATPEQAEALVAALRDPKAFGRPLRVPTLAADEPGYDPAGGYWCGGVWPSTTMMVLRGLENYGYGDEARKIALNNLDVMSEVLQRTGTIWEDYAPEGVAPGVPAKRDMVGWSGLGPIAWMLEYAVGLKPDAVHNELAWDLCSLQRTGCARYRFNGHVVSLEATPVHDAAGHYAISIKSDGAFALRLRSGPREKDVQVHSGEQQVGF
jgi:glycogen debranching enzyme